MSGGYVTLLGAEQVQAAAGTMRGAADEMQRAASTIDSALERHAARVEDVQLRVEQAITEQPTLRDYFAAKAMASLVAGPGAQDICDHDRRFNLTNFAEVVALNAVRLLQRQGTGPRQRENDVLDLQSQGHRERGMNKTETRVVVSALRQAHVLITADRQTHYDSHADKRTGLVWPKAERSLAKAYAKALSDIDKALRVLDPEQPLVVDQGTGFLPKKLERLASASRSRS